MQESVQAGMFRSDLYYRLNVVGVTLPALRERRNDIPSLIQHILKNVSSTRGISLPSLDPFVQQFLAYQYDWPGNIRELKNVLEYVILFCKDGVVTWNDMPSYLISRNGTDVRDETNVEPQRMDGPSILLSADSSYRNAGIPNERWELTALLERANGNVSEVCRQMGVARTTVYRRLRKYGLIK